MGKDDFIMPCKYKKRFERWSGKKCKAIILAMFEYQETNTVNIPDEYYDSFEAIRDDMDILKEAYKRKCEINAINGAKGGKAKQANATERKRTGANLADKIREDKIREDKIDSLNNKKKEEERKTEFNLPFSPTNKRINKLTKLSDVGGRFM